MIRVGLVGGGVMVVGDDGGIDVSQVTPEVLAYGLSHVTRFGGQAGPYSVGEHSVHLYRWAKHCCECPQVRAGLLLHDGPECLGVGDVQRFVKRRYASDLRQFDGDVTAALWRGLTPKAWLGWHWGAVEEAVHRYDAAMGAVEAEEFGFPFEVADLPEMFCSYLPSRPVRGSPWSATVAEAEWLDAWKECVR